MKALDLTGKKFGKLTIIKYEGKNKEGRPLCLCECDCGNYKIIIEKNIKNGNTKSCGCLGKENAIKHGHSETRTYVTWTNMNKRCNNQNHKKYKYYGGRGIKVCGRWSNKNPKGFENFLEDMGERPKNKTLDRINNNDGYFKENCGWITIKQQHRNMRSNHMIPFNKKFLCLKDYCKIKNLNYRAILTRINKLGWSIQKALETPVRKYKN